MNGQGGFSDPVTTVAHINHSQALNDAISAVRKESRARVKLLNAELQGLSATAALMARISVELQRSLKRAAEDGTDHAWATGFSTGFQEQVGDLLDEISAGAKAISVLVPVIKAQTSVK